MFLGRGINRTKAIFGGRAGQPLLQPLLRPVEAPGQGGRLQPDDDLGLSGRAHDRRWPRCSGGHAWCRSGRCAARSSFAGDLILLAYLLGLARLFTVLAALDTGSPFEGMGASREVLFSALAEPALLLGWRPVRRDAASARRALSMLSLTDIHRGDHRSLDWSAARLTLVLVAVSLSWSSWPRTPAFRSTTRTPTSN